MHSREGAGRDSHRESKIIAEALCSMWQQHLRNRHWHPIRYYGGNVESIQIKDDESLQGLKKEWGDEIYNAVVTALKELLVFSRCTHTVVPEIWNFKENREAETEEAISYVFTQLIAQKGKCTQKSATILK